MKQSGQYYWYHNDHLGTPQVMTTSSGAVVWSAKYSSSGKAIVDPSSTIVNPLRFPGQYFDDETGLHWNWFRYYESSLGRYLRNDPIGFFGGDVNLYAYVQNNPINDFDPLGLVSAGQLGIGNPGSYGGENDCKSMYDEEGPWYNRDLITWQYMDISDVPMVVAEIPIGPGAFTLFRNALRLFKGQSLTNVGRALTKHPEVIGQTKQTIRQLLRTDPAINKAAANALKDIMRTGNRTVQNLPRYGEVIQYQKAGGFGARFSAETGKFIGFINP
jgi:RHS repeat-associated protein